MPDVEAHGVSCTNGFGARSGGAGFSGGTLNGVTGVITGGNGRVATTPVGPRDAGSGGGGGDRAALPVPLAGETVGSLSWRYKLPAARRGLWRNRHSGMGREAGSPAVPANTVARITPPTPRLVA